MATDPRIGGPSVDGVLLDIDGVLTVSWDPLPGARETMSWLRSRAVPVRLMTNTTSRTRASLADALGRAGIDVDADEILNAPGATAVHLRDAHPGARCWVLTSGDVTDDLEGVDVVGGDAAADVVVLGGAGPELTYEAIDHAFRLLRGGAAFVAMHRNMTWRVADGLALDAGAYVAGLEAATGVTATVVGKPARTFFDAALTDLALPAENVIMVGDDLEADVHGAQGAGLRGVLVRTGKFDPDALAAAEPQPDVVIDGIGDLPGLLAP
jgi:HAD superfamily hydrolase (TIGR01458 family)